MMAELMAEMTAVRKAALKEPLLVFQVQVKAVRMALPTVVEMVFQKADLKDLWASMTGETMAETMA